jgi:hypothetical protein
LLVGISLGNHSSGMEPELIPLIPIGSFVTHTCVCYKSSFRSGIREAIVTHTCVCYKGAHKEAKTPWHSHREVRGLRKEGKSPQGMGIPLPPFTYRREEQGRNKVFSYGHWNKCTLRVYSNPYGIGTLRFPTLPLGRVGKGKAHNGQSP